ncbi:RidA family protein [Providencia stuartii]|nr:RidA family protein [Providencia stuartii]
MSKKSINPSSVFNSLQYGFSQAIETTGTRQLFLSGQVGVDANQQTVAGGIY